MERLLILLKASLLAVMVIFLVVPLAAYSWSSINWQSHSDETFTQAAVQKRLILVYVHSTSCEWCRTMDEITWKNSAVINKLNNRYIPISLDLDENKYIAMQYKVLKLPTIIIVNPNNRQVMNMYSGFQNVKRMTQILK